MIKKFIMKIIRKNKNIREYVIDGCIAEDLILQEQKSEILSRMNLSSTISGEYLKNKFLVFNNCLFINTRIEGNKIEGEFKLKHPYNTYISNNIGINTSEEEEKVEIPIFMK